MSNRPQSDYESPVKAGFFIYFMAFFAAVSAFTVLANLAMGLPFYLNYKWIAITGTALGLALWARHANNVSRIHRLGVYLTAFAVFPVAWMSSAGLVSPAITYAVLVIVMINYLLTGLERTLINMLYIALVLALISVFHFYPGQFTTLTPTEQYLDWVVNVPLVLGFLAVMLARFERAYESERRENALKAEELRQLSVTDPLTGLGNRLGLRRELARAVALYQRRGDVFSLIFLDVDHFKAYNDHYGHAQGDDCLRQVADCIRAGLRRMAVDQAYRFGGEEFVILLPDTDMQGAARVGERIRAEFHSAAISHAASTGVGFITVSMGVADVAALRATGEAVIAAADTALYQAKADGRDRVVCAPPAEQPQRGKEWKTTPGRAAAGGA